MLQQDRVFDEDAELSLEESAILEKALKGQLSDKLKEKKISRRDIHSPVPMSYAQHRLWILDRLVPGNPFYNVSSAIRLQGKLNLQAFEQSVKEIIHRHESLRTVFTMGPESNEPVQVIREDVKLKVDSVDLRELPPGKQWEEIVHLAEQEARKAFDLEKGPLMRVTLLRRDNEDHVLLLIVHHIICDGWSLGILIKELGSLYEAFSTGKPSPLPPPPIQYADFALWQRKKMQGEELKKQLSFWKELLSGQLPLMELPTDHQRPAVPTYRGGSCSASVPGTVVKKLVELNQKQKCSMFMTLLAALDILFYRYSGQDDILIGFPIANRNKTELELLIGYFANTLVLRTRLYGNPTFRELQNRVRKMTSGVYDNQDLPFEKLVEEFQPARYMSHTPFFQVMIHYDHGNASEEKKNTFGKLKINTFPIYNRTSKFDLWFGVTHFADQLQYSIEHSSDIFEGSTIKRLMGHFNNLLAGIGANPDQRIDDLPMLSDEEKTRILVQWNNTRKEYEIKCLHHSFAAQVEKTPDNIAVVAPMEMKYRTYMTYITYRELNENSNRLAVLLKEKAVQPDIIVGIMADRSVEMVIGLLGILKAGGAYLPLDPQYPEERIDFMLSDSNAKVLVTTPGLWGESKGIKIDNCQLSIVNCQRGIACSAQSKSPLERGTSSTSLKKFGGGGGCLNPRPATRSSQVAYVIYTSGSTGKPKGVMIAHEGISNRLLWMQEAFGLNGDDRILQKTPYSFDVSVWEFFWPLLTGAALVVAKPGGHKDCAYLVEVIIREKVTTIHFVPAMLYAFLEEPGTRAARSLKRVISSGEALPIEYVENFRRRFQPGTGTQLYNLYGPTEASIDVTYWQCTAVDNRGSAPIGRPIANTQIYILDRNSTPVPIGVPGEIHIGGVQLARGYLNNPELTNEKFCLQRPGRELSVKIAPPGPPRKNFLLKRTGKNYMQPCSHAAMQYHSPSPHSPNYRTGDLAHWLSDGTIEFLGRLDFQVKVRGFRIELGEIELQLRNHPYLEDAVVLAREDVPGTGENKLCAYIILNRDYWAHYQEKSGTDLVGEQVSDWQEVFNETYIQDSRQDPYFNIAGWNSSYTGAPISAREMRQWVDYTVERILSLKPGKVLEIGCGNGLLLFPIIPSCEFYMGTDISKQGLDYTRQQLTSLQSTPKTSLAAVELRHQPADDFQGLEPGAFDLVILNSVIQYFPGVEYLLKILKGAVNSVKPGGHIFIGDVRSLLLLKAFHASVEFYKARSDAPETTKDQLNQKVMNRLTLENELTLDPGFFTALKGYLPRIKQVSLLLKRGQYHNELTKFRYDVILHIDTENKSENTPGVISTSLDWQKDHLTLPSVRQLLLEKELRYLEIYGIPNARLTGDSRILNWMGIPDPSQSIEQFPEVLPGTREIGIDPEEFWRLEQSLPYTVYITPAHFNTGTEGTDTGTITGGETMYNVVFQHRDVDRYAPPIDRTNEPPRPWDTYANDPLYAKVTSHLAKELKSYLKEKLPEYMLPFYFIPLETFPLTPHGKLNRKALPEPVRVTSQYKQDQVVLKARTPREKLFADTWKSILLVDEVGINDNFFSLGGDSVIAIRVISRINQQGFQLSIQDLYKNQTVEELAIAAGNMPAVKQGAENVAAINDPVPGIDRNQLARCLPPGTEIEDIYPTAPLQRHMVNVIRNQPVVEPPLFIFQSYVTYQRIKLDISILEKALQIATSHLPLLRTILIWEGLKEPLQVICKKAKNHLVYEDLSRLSPAEQEKRLQELRKEEWNRGFQRNHPIPLRLTVVKLEENQFAYLYTGDYSRSEGWSIGNFHGMLNRYYGTLEEGREIKWEPDNTYKNYLVNLTKQDLSKAKQYWQSVLNGISGPKYLMKAHPGNKSHRGTGHANQHIYISRETTGILNRLLQKNHLVFSTLTQAIWAMILSAYANERDVVFGFITTGRSVASTGIETMTGYAINLLPVRIKINPHQSLLDFLKQTWDNQVEWARFEYIQIDNIDEWLGISLEKPWFETYVVVQNADQAALDPENSGLFHAKMEYPLRLDVIFREISVIAFNYYRSYFADSMIKGIADNFQILLETIGANPDRTVGELIKIIDTERHKMYQNSQLKLSIMK